MSSVIPSGYGAVTENGGNTKGNPILSKSICFSYQLYVAGVN
jgi:hypothetical protein